MSSQVLETIKLVASFIGGGASAAVVGNFLKDRSEKRALRAIERQTRWLPLLEAAREVRERFDKLRNDYSAIKSGLPSWDGDFCELYTLSNGSGPIEDLGNVSPNPVEARRNTDTVYRTRVRMCHELNYAASSFYITAKYLAYAQQVKRDLNEGRLHLPCRATPEHILKLLSDVRDSLQGPGAGIISEQQESIGENVWGPNNGVISYSEFQHRLVNAPGWEQYLGLFRFFAHFHKKRDSEVLNTINALGPLCDELKRVFGRASRE